MICRISPHQKVLSLSIRGTTDDIDRLVIQIWQVKGIILDKDMTKNNGNILGSYFRF